MSLITLRRLPAALALVLLAAGCGGGAKATGAGATAAAASVAAAPAAAAASGATPGPEAIRANLRKHIPNMPPVDEVTPAAVPGLWEVRIGTDVLYTDGDATHLIRGEIIEAATRKNLTEERLAKLTAIEFASLPLADAIVWKSGKGTRKIAIFADPNCGYCKRFEQGLTKVDDLTVYTFLYPVLGPDSTAKSEAIWCAKDRATVWNDWMRAGKPIPQMMGKACATPLERNLAFGQKHRINGTPAIVFEDGVRVPGAISPDKIEERLKAVADAKKA